jgi:hypothetical protein
MTQQPTWQLVANLGDANPIEYGGYFVYRDTTGVYCEEAELLTPTENDYSETMNWEVHRFVLDRLERVETDDRILLVPFGFSTRTDLPRSIEAYDEWFSDDLGRVADWAGQTLEQMRNLLCSSDPIERAFAYQSIGEYHGLENLDSYPLKFDNRAEVEARYSKVSVVRASQL